ncbi:MAG: hypothetical protein K2Z81_20355 [Cyanobacteria bacterium]|nr:hypothetical protein [Cyanobacteriota bacterium]
MNRPQSNTRRDQRSNGSQRQQRTRSQGQCIAELSAALILLVPILLAVVDLGFIALGSTMGDTVCRDAARAAASGPPSSEVKAKGRKVTRSGSPFQRARSVIRKHMPTDMPIMIDDQPEVTESVLDVPPEDVGGAIDGEVSVKTSVYVLPIFIVRFACPEGVTLESKHTVPFTYVRIPEKKKA